MRAGKKFRRADSKADLVTLMRYVWSNIPKDTAALDVGANSGLFTQPFTEHFAKVVAVEPNLERANFLRRAFGERASVLCAACSATSGVEQLAVPIAEGGAALHSLGSIGKDNVDEFQRARGNVRLVTSLTAVTTIDAILARLGAKFGLIKIDVEGHEGSVLDGARTTLSGTDRPALFIEIERHHGPDALETFRKVAGAGYQCLAVNRGALEPCEDEGAFLAAQANPKVVNYLFVPRGMPPPA
ncbi:methyltransferase, FkbM family [Mesorhizobium muleiense]|uniref:Methyltransferase, FkbM family n=1 Tax=Mesorhizobium muleiense TaxID=1004279 RepID=A0A1G8I2T6_9HYPH|nr:methyltransferase, FkbM family [Mesorhizobium muleiense]